MLTEGSGFWRRYTVREIVKDVRRDDRLMRYLKRARGREVVRYF